jgi:hypothetical protein
MTDHGERRKRKKRKKRTNLHGHPVVAWRRKEKREGRRRGRFGVERRKSSIFWLILFSCNFLVLTKLGIGCYKTLFLQMYRIGGFLIKKL